MALALAHTTPSDLTSGKYLNDAYLGRTAAGGTAFTAVLPYQAGARTVLGQLVYTTGANAHIITVMTCMWDTTVATTAESGQADFRLTSTQTNTADGSVIANTDYFILEHEDGSLGAYLVSSTSGVTITAATNLTADVEEGAKAWFMGAPGDHPLRQHPSTPTATTITLGGGDFRTRVATGTVGQPMLFHSNNATAAGWANLAFYFE
jgi:V8-like Glu-specific endopeptidase